MTVKKRCTKCNKWYKRIDVWSFKKSFWKRRHVCRHCLQSFLQENNPQYEGDRLLWICAHCRPPQKFTDKDEYVRHHYIIHN